MTISQQSLALFQLLLAVFLSTIIGINRERREKDAGMRTHMLVGLGACLFASLSVMVFPEDESGRVAANIVTGIGFLGAGLIYRGEDKVHDLTTAASIWATAAVGMAVGLGAWWLAVGSTLLIWFILEIVHRFEVHIALPKD